MTKERIISYLDIMTTTLSEKVLSAFVAAIITEITGDLDGYLLDDADYENLGAIISFNHAFVDRTNVPSAAIIVTFIRKVEQSIGKKAEDVADGPLS